MCLWNFPGIFGIFRKFSVALLIYLDISGFIFAQENILNKKTFLSNWAEPMGPTQPAPAQSQAWPGPSATRGQGRQGQHGRRRRHLGRMPRQGHPHAL
jgi:hypothetical protein